MVNKNNNTEIGNFSLTQAHNKYKYDYATKKLAHTNGEMHAH